MRLTQKIQKAINVAADKHRDQVRKTDGLPFITHLFSVATILSEYTSDEDVICAGMLHDILEDVKGYKYADLEKDFGWRIASIVKEVSEDKDPDMESNAKATWEKRKKGYLKHLQKASKEAMLVCAADKIHNLLSMIESYKQQGDNMWQQFNASPERSLWFYKECFNVLGTYLNNNIVKYLGYVYIYAEKTIFENVVDLKTERDDLEDEELEENKSKWANFKLKNKIAFEKAKYSHSFFQETMKEFEAQYTEKDLKKGETSEDRAIRIHWAFQAYLSKKISGNI